MFVSPVNSTQTLLKVRFNAETHFKKKKKKRQTLGSTKHTSQTHTVYHVVYFVPLYTNYDSLCFVGKPYIVDTSFHTHNSILEKARWSFHISKGTKVI